jgi:hypothetical protein
MALMPYLLLIGVFPITYYLTHPMMDYRQPIEPAVVVLAVAGAMGLRAGRDKKKGAGSGAQGSLNDAAGAPQTEPATGS